jgi:hypothetical protein
MASTVSTVVRLGANDRVLIEAINASGTPQALVDGDDFGNETFFSLVRLGS